jgi:hypothetical protein
MLQLSPTTRYVVRELIPRAILLTVVFKWIMPLTRLFHFDGGWLAASLYALAFTAMISFLAGYIAGLPGVQKFLADNAKKWWTPLMHIGLVVGIPAVALCLAAVVAPSVFSMSWLYGPLAGSVILNIACAATHDWGAPR